jgi:hypothetical protein
METRRDRLFAVANLGSHATLFAANFSTSFACSLRSHSYNCSAVRCDRKLILSYRREQTDLFPLLAGARGVSNVLKNTPKQRTGKDTNAFDIRQTRFAAVLKVSRNSER